MPVANRREYYASARSWDDGVIHPTDTRDVLRLALSVAADAPLGERRRPVFRMQGAQIAIDAHPRTIPPLPAPGEAPRGADATAERLLRAAHELLHERGGAPFSVSEVCGRADANVAMVKYCFGNKDGLLMALTMRITASFRSDFERLQMQDMTWREKLERHVVGIVRNYLRFPYINRMLADQLSRADEPGTRELSESFAAPMGAFHRELLAEGRRTGELRAIDPVLFFFSVVGMCEFIFSARGWLVHGFGQRLDDEFVDRYVAHILELVLTGIEANERP